MEKIYFDYQSTTPVDPEVLDVMMPFFTTNFGNPHSYSHYFGNVASQAVEIARQQIAKGIGSSDPREIIFTSGATESNNLAIKGIARFYGSSRTRIVTSAIEHKCILSCCAHLKDEGFEVIILPVNKDGIVNLSSAQEAINDKTLLVSIQTVNNEIGTIQPVEEISKLCRANGAFFHTDAAQALGKISLDCSLFDLISFSGHKLYAPKGIGALYVRNKPRIRLAPLFDGGGQERGIRSGTLPTPLCVGFGKAVEIAIRNMSAESKRLLKIREILYKKIMQLPEVYLNGSLSNRIPGNLNFSIMGIEGESLMLSMPDVCISSGSACTSTLLEPSYVLNAIGIEKDLAHSSIRIGFGRFSTEQEAIAVGEEITMATNRLRSMSPLWPPVKFS